MISCRSQEDLLSYQFRSTAERDLITSKTLAEHGEKWKNPRVTLGENEKVEPDAFKQSHHMLREQSGTSEDPFPPEL